MQITSAFWDYIPNCYETESCVCVGCGGGSVCLLALSTKARWKIAWSYKQQIGNLIKIWCAQTRAYHCFSCVNLGFLGCQLRVFYSFKVGFFLNNFMAHFSQKHEHLWVMVPELLIWVESSLSWFTLSSQPKKANINGSWVLHSPWQQVKNLKSHTLYIHLMQKGSFSPLGF